MISNEDVDRLVRGHGHVMTTGGDRIGSIGAIYPDRNTAQPAWVAAKTGLTAGSTLLVPLEGARIDGLDILVPFSKDQVKDAPHLAADHGPSAEEEQSLRQHYQPGAGLRTYGEAKEEAGDDGGPASGDEEALLEGASEQASPDPITGDKEFLPDGRIGPGPVPDDDLGG